MVLTTESASASTSASTLPAQPVPEPRIQPAYAQIKHLCGTMSFIGLGEKHVGTLKDDTIDQQYSVFVQSEPNIPASSISLAELLRTPCGSNLTRPERYSLALTISSAHLQFQSTPWARQQWTSANIYFLKNGQNVLLERPYVEADFVPTNTPLGQLLAMPERSFACLGVILLELCFHQVLDDCHLWQKLGWTEAEKR